MRDAKTDTEEKADKEKRDWRTLDDRLPSVPHCSRRAARARAPAAIAGTASGCPDRRTPARSTTSRGRPTARTIVLRPPEGPDPGRPTTGDLGRPRRRDRRRRHGDAARRPARVAEDQAGLLARRPACIAFTAQRRSADMGHERERVRVVPAAGGASRALATTSDEQPDHPRLVESDGRALVVSEIEEANDRPHLLAARGRRRGSASRTRATDPSMDGPFAQHDRHVGGLRAPVVQTGRREP